MGGVGAGSGNRMQSWRNKLFWRTETQKNHNVFRTHNLAKVVLVFCRRRWHPTPVLLPGKSHGRRSLEGYSPWGHKESDKTEQLHFHFSLSCTGDGNGNPLQCSCLENARDGGAWWAAIYGVTLSRTRLKWLSSSVYTLVCVYYMLVYYLIVRVYI